MVFKSVGLEDGDGVEEIEGGEEGELGVEDNELCLEVVFGVGVWEGGR